MHFQNSLLYCAFGLLTCAYPTRKFIAFESITSRVCGTGPPSERLRSAHHKLHAQHRLHSRQTASFPIVVDTYLHFVTTDDQAPYYTVNTVSTLMENQVCPFLDFCARFPSAILAVSINLPLCKHIDQNLTNPPSVPGYSSYQSIRWRQHLFSLPHTELHD